MNAQTPVVATGPALTRLSVQGDSATFVLTGISSYEAEAFGGRHPRVVVELPGVEQRAGSRIRPARPGLIRAVRLRSHSRGGIRVTRVILHLRQKARMRMDRQGADLVLSLQPEEAAIPPARPGSYLHGIRVGNDCVRLGMSGPHAYKAWIEGEPPLLVLDLPGVSLRVPKGRRKGEGTLLEGLRWFQAGSQAEPRARLVLRLRAKALFRIDREDRDLVIRLEKPAELQAYGAGGLSGGK